MGDPKDGPVRGTTSAAPNASSPRKHTKKLATEPQTVGLESPAVVEIPGTTELPTMIEVPGATSSAEALTWVHPTIGSGQPWPVSPEQPAAISQGGIPLQPGTLLGKRYEILQLLGEGGMG